MFIHFLIFCAIYLVIGFITSTLILFLGNTVNDDNDPDTTLGAALLAGINLFTWPICVPIVMLAGVYIFLKEHAEKKALKKNPPPFDKNKVIDVP